MESKLSNVSDGRSENGKELKRQLIRYEEAALAHTEATINPDHRKANRNHDIIMKSAAYLKEHGELLQLSQFLSHPIDGVKVWAAMHLLPTELNEVATSTLKKIAEGSGFIATAAEMVLSEWSKGNLRS